MLARALEEHGGAVRADFQQYYGLNIDEMGEAYSTLHAAELLVELPGESRVKRIYSDDGPWTFDRTLMALAVNALNVLVWQRTKDGSKGRNRPEPIGPFARPRRRALEGEAMTIEELDALLSMPRTEVAMNG